MRRRYIVAVSGLTKDDEKLFLDFLKEKKLAWWHWIDGFWLLLDRRDAVSAVSLRDKLHELSSSRRSLVLEVGEDVTWAGFGPSKQGMFRWIKETWKKKD